MLQILKAHPRMPLFLEITLLLLLLVVHLS